MRILIACDKYKHSLPAIHVCQAIAKGLQETNENLHIILHPMADGGDGTLAVLNEHMTLQSHELDTINPLGKTITANYASYENTAYIELAEASGIARLEKSELNPMLTTTIGTGYLIKDAIANGYEHIVLSIGGSCTTEAGLGIAYALGFSFFDIDGIELIPCGETLSQIHKIVSPPDVMRQQFTVLCDVDNPLYGPQGAAYIFSPQKGASDHQVKRLDKGLRHIAKQIYLFNGKQIDTIKGGGAAGGIAAGVYGLLDAQIVSGFEYLSNLSNLEDKIASADLVISGEGQLDHQSFSGKVVGQIESICRKYKKPIISIVGRTTLTHQEHIEKGLQHVFSILPVAKNVDDAMNHADEYLIEISKNINLDQFAHRK